MTCMSGLMVVRLQSLQERQASRHNAAGDHRTLVEMDKEEEVLHCPTSVFIKSTANKYKIENTEKKT